MDVFICLDLIPQLCDQGVDGYWLTLTEKTKVSMKEDSMCHNRDTIFNLSIDQSISIDWFFSGVNAFT